MRMLPIDSDAIPVTLPLESLFTVHKAGVRLIAYPDGRVVGGLLSVSGMEAWLGEWSTETQPRTARPVRFYVHRRQHGALDWTHVAPYRGYDRTVPAIGTQRQLSHTPTEK